MNRIHLPMSNGAATDILVNVNMPDMLRKNGANTASIHLLLEGFVKILCGTHVTTLSIDNTTKKTRYTSELLFDEFGVRNVDFLLASLLYDVFHVDVKSALNVAYMFGDDICLVVHTLLRTASNEKYQQGRYASVEERFNNASTEKEKKLFSSVVMIWIAENILLARRHNSSPSVATGNNSQDEHYRFVQNFINQLDMDLLWEDCREHFFHAKSVLLQQLYLNELGGKCQKSTGLSGESFH